MSLEGRQVLVTGATGFIGGRLVEELVLAQGATVRCMVRDLRKASRIARFDLDIVQGEDFPTQAAEKGRTLLDGLKERLDNHPHVGEVRGLGLMAAVEIVEDRQTKAEFDADEKVGARINQAMQNHGLFSRMRGDVVCLAPPIVITDQELEQVIDAVTNAIGDVLGA